MTSLLNDDTHGAGPEPDNPFNASPTSDGQILPGRSDRLRVCLITTEFHGLFRNGGIGTANTGLALALSEAHFDVTVAFADADQDGPRVKVGNFPELQEKYRQLGITLDFVPANPLVAKAFEDCRSASYCVYLYIKQHDFDVVYFNDCGGSGYYSLLAKYVGAFHNAPRMYVVAHGPQEWVLDINSIFWDRSTIIISYMERRSVELADALISPSQFMVDWMTSNGWTKPKEVLVVQNIVPLAEFAEHAISASRPTPITEIVFFGRLEVRKGIELFCNAIDLLHQSTDLTGIKVTFMGKFGHIDGLHSGVYVFERGGRWRSSLRILATYGQDEALSYLNRPGVLAVIPSFVENSPCAVSECLQLGIPFVATGSGGTVELVAPEDRDLCLVAADPKKLAAKLDSCLKSGQKPARLAISQVDVRAQWLSITSRGTGEPAQPADLLPSAPQGEARHERAGTQPLVSICVVHSSLASNADTLIDSLLRQSYPNLEFVLFDDVVGPESSGVAALNSDPDRVPLRLLPGVRGDRSAARNAAAAEASGDYLLFVAEEMVVLRPECVQAMVAAALRTDADIVTAVGSQFQPGDHRADQPEGKIRYIPTGACVELGGFENCFGGGVLLTDRASFLKGSQFGTLCDPEIEDWLFLVTSVLSGRHLEVVPEPLFRFNAQRRGGPVRHQAVDNHRRILAAFNEQKIRILRHAIEANARFDGLKGERLRVMLDGVSTEAQKIAQRVSTACEPNSEEAFRGLIQFCLERKRAAEAMDFALHNGRSLLHDAIGAAKLAAETAAIDAVRHNALDMWHEIALSDDIRPRIYSVSVFPARKLERPPGAVASHSIDSGTRILKAAAVCPPLTQSVRAVAHLEATGPISASLAFVVSAPNAHLRLLNQNLESNEPFWWSGWIQASEQEGKVELKVAMAEPAKALLDLHFLCKADEDTIHSEARVTWESVSANLQVNGAFTSSSIESVQVGTPVSRSTLEQGILMTEHADFPFPVYVPGDDTLLHPLPDRPALVRIKGAVPPGARGVRSIVSLQRAEAHPVQFAVWIRPSSAPAMSETDFIAADPFSGWFPVTDKFRPHSFTLTLKERTIESMDLYLATRVEEFPDVHYCHAVWHELLILTEDAASAN